MFIKEDNTYNDIRRRSLNNWLDEMSGHEDVAVRCGVTLVRDYIDYLNHENERLRSENQLKNEYLKKLKNK